MEHAVTTEQAGALVGDAERAGGGRGAGEQGEERRGNRADSAAAERHGRARDAHTHDGHSGPSGRRAGAECERECERTRTGDGR